MNDQLVTGRTATIVKLLAAGLAKGFAAISAFVLTALVTRNLNGEEAGLFLLGFTLLVILSVVVRQGLDNVILRYLSANGMSESAQEKLCRGLLRVGSLSIVLTVTCMLLSDFIAEYIFQKPEFASTLFWLLPALPSMALFYLISVAFQSQHRVILATLSQNLGVSALFIIGFSLIWAVGEGHITIISMSQLYSVSALTVLIFSLIIWFSHPKAKLKLVGFRDRDLTRASMNLWSATMMSLAVQWSGIVVAGVILSSTDIAILNAAQRTAALISFVLLVVNLVVVPRFAVLWKEGNISKIRQLAKWAARGGVLLISFPFVLMILFSGEILQLFGDDYSEGAMLLIIMAVGQFINVAVGPVGYLLNMCGHEKDFNVIVIISGFTTIIFTVFLVFEFGALGAAWANVIGITLLNLGTMYLVKKRLGFVPAF